MANMRIAIWTLAAISVSAPAFAGHLPAGSKPVPSSRVRSIYSGKTAHWKISTVYFAPNGRVKGYTNDRKTTLNGTWSVSGNRACMHVRWHDLKRGKHGKSTDCWDWYLHGRKKWTLWSVHYNGTKPKPNDYYTGEEKNLRRGDGASRTLATLNG